MTITFKDFILETRPFIAAAHERIGDLYRKEYNKFFDEISDSCSEIIEIYRKAFNESNGLKFLWRGIKGQDNIFRNKIIHQNRRTLEMPIIVHNTINDISKEAGFEAHRGNSIFTTTSEATADEWGKSYIIFPLNGFKYTWFKSQKRNYMFYKFIDIATEVFNNVRKQYVLKYADKLFPQQEKTLDELNIYFDLSDAETGLPGFEEMYKSSLEKMLRSQFMKLEPQKTGLENLLRSSHTMASDAIDVLISGKSYSGIYLIRPEIFDEVFYKRFIA